jgi:hypothetical protein
MENLSFQEFELNTSTQRSGLLLFSPDPDTFKVTFDDLKIKWSGHIHILVNARWTEYLQENLKVSWIVIDPTRKRAANLLRSTYKPRTVTLGQLFPDLYYKVVYDTVMAGTSQVRSKMVKCQVKVTCCCSRGDGLSMRRVVIGMEDMTRNRGRKSRRKFLVNVKQGVTILLNAIQNGERKKFNLPKQDFDKFQISDPEREKAGRLRYDALQRNRIRKFVPNTKLASIKLH